MLLFYQPAIATSHFLDTDDSRHCVKVLRKTPKDIIHVVDGTGGLYECEITKANEKKCEVKIVSWQTDFQKRNTYLHIAIAPTKNADRLEWFIEKAVEIGIDEISLILTKHSERRQQKTERLEKIAVSAMKQSLKAYLPRINELVPFEKFLKSVLQEQKFLAHLTEESKPLVSKLKPGTAHCIMVGPEGDFAAEEIQLARDNGFEWVTLGNARLRTETAGLVACTLSNNMF
ncbi:16S rRNA (uracil(1498)-N(3))-methyltransferase [Emticicia sp. TH156]|uniref:16S rRNA (uracil(1498)-N(3))-methyltransferase n=1 Tax=Emticicia sp. TH156 TaxID=2067454 RepID=UPI000C7799EA|nr:16S rRNA (uracil(1498)-N(3))-methyltransferase [Emticicia sp. TH156]PLK43646.1 16S rRNA (uracil(1498)-N(3))-methyltransferase [Emticicia sp. TH156]